MTITIIIITIIITIMSINNNTISIPPLQSITAPINADKVLLSFNQNSMNFIYLKYISCIIYININWNAN